MLHSAFHQFPCFQTFVYIHFFRPVDLFFALRRSRSARRAAAFSDLPIIQLSGLPFGFVFRFNAFPVCLRQYRRDRKTTLRRASIRAKGRTPVIMGFNRQRQKGKACSKKKN